MARLNSSDSFLAFDIQKLTRLAKFYPSDFFETDVLALDFSKKARTLGGEAY